MVAGQRFAGGKDLAVENKIVIAKTWFMRAREVAQSFARLFGSVTMH